eukprot:3264733-Amphidinium_carterae.13
MITTTASNIILQGLATTSTCIQYRNNNNKIINNNIEERTYYYNLQELGSRTTNRHVTERPKQYLRDHGQRQTRNHTNHRLQLHENTNWGIKVYRQKTPTAEKWQKYKDYFNNTTLAVTRHGAVLQRNERMRDQRDKGEQADADEQVPPPPGVPDDFEPFTEDERQTITELL